MIRHPFARCVAAFACIAVATSCSSPQSEAARTQQILEMADEINAIKNEMGELRGTVDSLRIVAMKADTTIARLANVTGVVVVK